MNEESIRSRRRFLFRGAYGSLLVGTPGLSALLTSCSRARSTTNPQLVDTRIHCIVEERCDFEPDGSYICTLEEICDEDLEPLSIPFDINVEVFEGGLGTLGVIVTVDTEIYAISELDRDEVYKVELGPGIVSRQGRSNTFVFYGLDSSLRELPVRVSVMNRRLEEKQRPIRQRSVVVDLEEIVFSGRPDIEPPTLSEGELLEGLGIELTPNPRVGDTLFLTGPGNMLLGDVEHALYLIQPPEDRDSFQKANNDHLPQTKVSLDQEGIWTIYPALCWTDWRSGISVPQTATFPGWGFRVKP